MRSVTLVVLIGMGLAGCQRYRAQPLDPRAEMRAVEAERQAPGAGGGALADAAAAPRLSIPSPLTFPRAAELLARQGPALREARAEYETALALAGVKTPFPNPALELGPQFGFGPDASSNKVQPFGSLGFTFPTAGKRKKQDDLNRLGAQLLQVELQALHRELYLGLRRSFAQWMLAGTKLGARKQIEASAAQSLAAAKKQIEAGAGTALDFGLVELDAARMTGERLAAEGELAVVEAELAELLGIQAALLATPTVPPWPELPAHPPSLESLKVVLLGQHPQLARLRAQYEVVEAELRLEIAKQYPDFHFGPSAEGETGEKKVVLGLALGIELPIFDRNQQQIASALKRREEIRARYQAAASRALGALERAWRAVSLAREQLKLAISVLRPKAAANTDLARRAVEVGAADMLHYLESQRGQRLVQIEGLEAEFRARESWVELEQAAGWPLIAFPGEEPESYPLLPGQPAPGAEALEPGPAVPAEAGPAKGVQKGTEP